MHVCTDASDMYVHHVFYVMFGSIFFSDCGLDCWSAPLRKGSQSVLPISPQCVSTQNRQQAVSSSGSFVNASDSTCSPNATTLHSKSAVTVNIKIGAYLLFWKNVRATCCLLLCKKISFASDKHASTRTLALTQNINICSKESTKYQC